MFSLTVHGNVLHDNGNVMPKVSEEYIEQKKQHIITSALSVCDRKTMSSIIMQDVIDESGLSQGGIYRFYQNIDDILIEVMNRIREGSLEALGAAVGEFAARLGTLREQGGDLVRQRREAVHKLIEDLCGMLPDMMAANLHPYFSIEHGFRYLRMNYPERAEYMLGRLSSGPLFEQAYEAVRKELDAEVRDGVFHPKVPVSHFLEGIGIQMAGLIEMLLLEEKMLPGSSSPQGLDVRSHARIMLLECHCLLGLEDFLEEK